jgi:hypothetical protein
LSFNATLPNASAKRIDAVARAGVGLLNLFTMATISAPLIIVTHSRG